MRTKLAAGLVSILLAAPFAAVPAFSAGGGGDSTPECTNGKVWDSTQQKCVEKSSSLSNDDIYNYGRMLALNGKYGEAIEVLSLASDKSDPRILNYLGYSHRKQGRVEVGLGYYEEALKANPDYTLAREYMGEAYIQLGDVASAQAQLSEIEKRCGTGCDEYTELSKQIDTYLKS
jgi:tetratricopeptide (TPR) repeat protein